MTEPVQNCSAGSWDAPEVWKDCEVCGGEGMIHKPIFVYEHGCGFGHDDVHSVECDACAGNGGFICEAEPDPQ